MAGMDWFRWHHGSVNDPKFQLVAKRSASSVAEVLAVWASLLESASLAEPRGSVGAIDLEALECALGLEDGQALRIVDAMRARDLLTGDDGRVTAWERRQPKREREDGGAAERKRAQRERDAADGGASDGVTPIHATSRQVTPRGEESREEKKEEKAGSASPRGSRLPPDWEPSAEEVAYCRTTRPDLDPKVVAQDFRDYWVALPGKDGRKLNWPATWQKWVRGERAPKPGQVSTAGVVATVPGRQGRDPELIKRELDAARAAKPSAEIAARIAELKGTVAAA